MEALDATEWCTANAGETISLLIMHCKDGVIFITKIAKVRAKVHKTIVREQLNCVLSLTHPERRLQREKPKRCIVEIIRLVNRQRF